jgi:2-oxoisovalerate dehydrogenase E1 component
MIKRVSADIRENPRPILIECMTFRMRGHEEASGTKYYPEGMQEEWAKQDPISNFEAYLMDHQIITPSDIESIKEQLSEEINSSLDIVIAEPDLTPNTTDEIADLYKPFELVETVPSATTKEMRMVDAIADAMDQAMMKHDNLILMGQDIAEYGGVFKITDGSVAKYGRDRVRNTPLCEAAIVGTSQGLSITGFKAMMEFQFADFVTEGFNQLINNVAKLHWRWGQNVDVVFRMPTGAGVAAGPFHSQSNEAWFTHTPGLKIVYPAFPLDAKGLLLTAFEDPNPVMFFEHKKLYRSLSQEVPEGYYTIPFGKAAKVRSGLDVTIVSYGLGVHWAIEILDQHPHISADLIDLRTLSPLDTEAIYESVRATNRVIVLHEDCTFGGIGGELVTLIQEHCFEDLDTPVKRVGSLDTPIPFNAKLEDNFLAKNRFEKALVELMEY